MLLNSQLQIKPGLSNHDAKRVVENLFEIQVIDVKPLNSYLDQNFKITCKIADLEIKTFNLKVLNSDDSKNKNLIEAEHEIFMLLKTFKVSCPVSYFNKKNESFFFIDENYQVFTPILGENLKEPNKVYIGRLLGKILGEVKIYTRGLLFSVGKFAGSLDGALKGFYDEIYVNRDCIWRLDKIRNYIYRLEYVSDDRRPVLSCIIEKFFENIMNDENSNNLRKGMIHGDFNETNILVDDSENQVCGILDFGDTSYSYYVFEIAICALYMMLDATKPEGSCEFNQIEIAAHTIAGYINQFKLNKFEYSSILICIKTRIAQSLMNGCYCNRLNPDDNYVMITQVNSWNLLCLLNEMGDDNVYNLWENTLMNCYKIDVNSF